MYVLTRGIPRLFWHGASRRRGLRPLSSPAVDSHAASAPNSWYAKGHTCSARSWPVRGITGGRSPPSRRRRVPKHRQLAELPEGDVIEVVDVGRMADEALHALADRDLLLHVAHEQPRRVVHDARLGLVEQHLPLADVRFLVGLVEQRVNFGHAIERGVDATLVGAVEEHAEEVLRVASVRLPAAEGEIELARAPIGAILRPLAGLDLRLDANRFEVLLYGFRQLAALRVVATSNGVGVDSDRLALVARVLQQLLGLRDVVRVALDIRAEAPRGRRQHASLGDSRTAVP